MKRFLFMLVATMFFATGAVAQKAVEESNLFDNMSLTIKGGATTPLKTPIENVRGVVGVELEKMLTPTFGLGVEGEWTVNTSSWTGAYSNYIFDHQYVGLYGVTNLNNLLAGYKGKPREFEVETVLGVGWGHGYVGGGIDENTVVTKTGLNLNWNLGKDKQWSITLKPAVVWNMCQIPTSNRTYANYNINRAALQLQAGVTYHFEGPTSRHFVISDKRYTQAEVDRLNEQINTLREEGVRDREACNKQVNVLLETNKALMDELKKAKEVKESEVVEVQNYTPIQFKQGSAMLINSDAALKALAESMIKEGGKYTIVGFASEEGSEKRNIELSTDRAAVVADELIFWGVNPDNIQIKGAGATNQFGDQYELNRVVIIQK